MGSKQAAPTTQTVTNAPPAYLEPFLRNAAQSSVDMFNRGGGFYSGETIAPLSGTTNQFIDLATSRAINGNPLDATAQQTAMATARGDFLGANPFLDRMADAANRSTVRQFRDATMPGLQGSFSRAGRFGSNAQTNAVQGAQEALATGLADANSRLYGTEYGNERQRMLAAAGMAPALTQTDFRNLQVLEGVGGTLDDRAQAQLQAQIMQAENPRRALDDLISRLSGVRGSDGTATTMTPGVRSSRAAGALGGAAAGGGIASMLGVGAGPVGWGLLGGGALLGML